MEPAQRYKRQIEIEGIGAAGQKRLEKARVLIAGAGGLGSVIATYLAVAGTGRLRLVDNDIVEESNLNRQILYGDADIGKRKVEISALKLKALNRLIAVEPVFEKLDKDSVSQIAEGSDVIVDAMDNFAARYALNNYSVANKIPFFHGAVSGFEGRVTTIVPGVTPCLKCIYKNAPEPGLSPVIGVTPAIIGSLQAMEVIKYITGIGELLTGRLLVVDGLKQKYMEIKLSRRPDCDVCRHL